MDLAARERRFNDGLQTLIEQTGLTPVAELVYDKHSEKAATVKAELTLAQIQDWQPPEGGPADDNLSPSPAS